MPVQWKSRGMQSSGRSSGVTGVRSCRIEKAASGVLLAPCPRNSRLSQRNSYRLAVDSTSAFVVAAAILPSEVLNSRLLAFALALVQCSECQRCIMTTETKRVV